MPVQETFANGIPNLTGNTATVFAALIAAVVLAPGAEQVLHLFDTGLPWRQLLVGRSVKTLTLSWRYAYAIAGSYIAARFQQAAAYGI